MQQDAKVLQFDKSVRSKKKKEGKKVSNCHALITEALFFFSGKQEEGIFVDQYRSFFLFLPAAKPSDPRTVGVVLVLVGRVQFGD